MKKMKLDPIGSSLIKLILPILLLTFLNIGATADSANNCNASAEQVQESQSEIENCIICLAPLTDNQRTFHCTHVFHGDCIDSWFEQSNKCPCCRKIIGPEPETDEFEIAADSAVLASLIVHLLVCSWYGLY